MRLPHYSKVGGGYDVVITQEKKPIQLPVVSLSPPRRELSFLLFKNVARRRARRRLVALTSMLLILFILCFVVVGLEDLVASIKNIFFVKLPYPSFYTALHSSISQGNGSDEPRLSRLEALDEPPGPRGG